jgi:hypothetical protein
MGAKYITTVSESYDELDSDSLSKFARQMLEQGHIKKTKWYDEEECKMKVTYTMISES